MGEGREEGHSIREVKGRGRLKKEEMVSCKACWREIREVAGVGVGGVGKAPAPIQAAGTEGVYRIRKIIVLQPPAK